MLLNQENFNEIFNPNLKNKTFLLACSGGKDSVALFHLLLNGNYRFKVAHCNFELRGEDSEKDEDLVRELCEKNKISFYLRYFNLKDWKTQNNYSTQMAARDARYEWFNDLLNDKVADYILTAHHLNDSLETFLINLSRGSGLKGLCGVPELGSNIYRPLLHFTSDEILDYAQKNNLSWREDLSNQTDDYVRNKVRHHVVPTLKQTFPNFLSSFEQSLFNLQGSYDLLEYFVVQEKEKLFRPTSYGYSIKIDELKQIKSLPTFLHFAFSPYGFGSAQELEKFLDAQNGAEIQSPTHRLINDRGWWLLLDKKEIKREKITINSPNEILLSPFEWQFLTEDRDRREKIISFDLNKVKFPLSLRTLNLGDVFYPLGMNGQKKKVSKFFKDEKFSKFEKENTWLLCDANDQIMWIVGHRADERYKITEQTKQWLHIKKYSTS